MTQLLHFVPLYQERVWGGRELARYLGRHLPGTSPIGESWEIVDRAEAQSVVSGGAWQGKTLGDLMREHRVDIMGPAWPAERPFPILVKWLDCRDRLSVQVHPPAGIAASLNGEPKTENWYFGLTDAKAAVYAGLRPGVTRAEFEQAIAAGTVDRCLDHLPVQAGDSLLIHSGTMHAIDAGNVILEIQQNSDTTYRVYDWGRMGLDGKPRALHVRESLACLAANTSPAPRLIPAKTGAGEIAQCREFTIKRVVLGAGQPLSFAAGQQARIVSVVAGELACSAAVQGTVKQGDNVLLAYGGEYTFVACSAATVLVTEDFGR